MPLLPGNPVEKRLTKDLMALSSEFSLPLQFKITVCSDLKFKFQVIQPHV